MIFSHCYRGHKLDSDGRVLVEIEGFAPSEIKCDYLVGADGVRSEVRRDLGIELSG